MTYLKNICKIYPTIIKNMVEMKTIIYAAHWVNHSQKLSDTYVKDLRKIITSEHSELYEFYGNERANALLIKVLNHGCL